MCKLRFKESRQWPPVFISRFLSREVVGQTPGPHPSKRRQSLLFEGQNDVENDEQVSKEISDSRWVMQSVGGFSAAK